MDSKNQRYAISTSSRPLANYHPNIWGDRFLLLTTESNNQEVREKQIVEELKEKVKIELNEASNDYMQQLKLVDAIQRLGVDYLFKEEIDEALLNLSEKFDIYGKDKLDMHATSLSFRLLRQHGYRVSCQVFDKFKDNKGGFKLPKIEEVIGVLELFEATHLRIHGEEVLDHAFVFTRNYLESILPSLSNPFAQQVHHALYEHSNWRGMPRIEARKYISIYEKYSSHHPVLLKLTKLDFNLVQAMHKRELSELSRWWKSLEVPKKLPYARDRLVETYFWDCGVYFEPQYALARIMLIKVQAILSLIDDTYDAYGTLEELQLFTDAFQRWDISCLDQLPENMKIIYKALVEVFSEIEKEMIKLGTLYRLNYVIAEIKILVGAYLEEIKWREEKYKPTTQEYMQVATKSCGYVTVIIISFLGMAADVATKAAFDWVLSKPQVIRASLTICRLANDIAGFEFEKGREHIHSAVECYREEHQAVSKHEIMSEFRSQMECAWKDINEVFLRPTPFPTPILYRILNFVRALEVIYDKYDHYTHVRPEMQTFINNLFIHPIHL